MSGETAQTIVEQGGGVFRGIQRGYPELGIEPLILFDGPSRSTMGVKPADASPERIRTMILEKEAQFRK